MPLNKSTQVIILVASKKELSISLNLKSVFVYEIGVGKINTLVSLSTLMYKISALKINPIFLNVGTVGSVKYPIEHILYPENYAQGDTYIGDFFLENTRFYTGKGKIKSIERKNFNYSSSILTSDRFINTNTNFYKQVQHLQVDAFDMESYAIAHFCYEHNIPFHTIKIVSDNCDGTIKDWENILHKISNKLGKIVEEYLTGIIKL